MKLRLLRDFLPGPLPLKTFIPRSFGHSANTSDPSANQDREAGRNSSKAEHSNPAPIGHFYRFLCRAQKLKVGDVVSITKILGKRFVSSKSRISKASRWSVF